MPPGRASGGTSGTGTHANLRAKGAPVTTIFHMTEKVLRMSKDAKMAMLEHLKEDWPCLYNNIMLLLARKALIDSGEECDCHHGAFIKAINMSEDEIQYIVLAEGPLATPCIPIVATDGAII